MADFDNIELDEESGLPEESIGEDNSELDRLYNEFNEKFPIEKLRNLSIEEYTNLKEHSEDYFCTWVERRTGKLGSIQGATSLKFGIYKYSEPPRRECECDQINGYAWPQRYGKDDENHTHYKEVFETVKKEIIAIAEAAQKDEIDYNTIDKSNLSTMFKWKIAFLYSRKRLLPIFAEPMLKYLAFEKDFSLNKKTQLSEIQKFLLQAIGQSNFWDYTRNLWQVWNQRNKAAYNDFPVNQWHRLFGDSEVFSDQNFDVLRKYLDLGGKATFRQISDEYGNTPDHYKLINTKLAGRIAERLGLDLEKNSSGNDLRLRILFNEKKVDSNKNDSEGIIWELKPNLKIALEKYDLTIYNTFWYVGTQPGKADLNSFIKEGYWEGGQVNRTDVMNNIKSVRRKHIFIAREHGYKGEHRSIPFIRPIAIGIVGEDIKLVNNDWYFCKVKWFTIKNPKEFIGASYKRFWTTMDACKDIEIKKYISQIITDNNTMKDKNLEKQKSLLETKRNIILQGAPGTGKTYSTAALALSICDDELPSDHKDVMNRYEELIKQGRIGFVTFHQSMDYEDFIEGIKPKTNSGQISYEIEDGIFKIICKNASQIKSSKKSEKIDFSKTRIFKMSLGEKGKTDSATFDYCHEKNVIALGWGRDIDFSDCDTKEKIREKDHTWGAFAIEVFKLWMRIGDIVLISDGNRAIKAIAKITGNYEFHNDRLERMKQYRNVEWLYTGDSIPISKIYDKNLSQQSIYAFGNRIDENHVENGSIKENILNDIITGDIEKEKLQNYVLIIDEINRGNVSKIFGELISLLEADKRAGGDHPLTVTLPYSKEPFLVPSNLYVIGTMNTTDRSVGSIDYAVRRRFAFYTLKANKDALESYYNDKASALKQKAIILYGTVEKFIKDNQCSGIDFNDLMVGHSYFMAKDFDELNLKWDYEVIPLLEEYKKDGLLKQSADLDIIRNCENYSENQDTQTTLNNPSEQ